MQYMDLIHQVWSSFANAHILNTCVRPSLWQQLGEVPLLSHDEELFPSLVWKDSTVLHSEPWRQPQPVLIAHRCCPHECYFGWTEASRFNIWNWKIGGSRNKILILHDPAKPKCKPLWWHRTGLLTSIWQPPVRQYGGHHLGFLEPGVTTFGQEKGSEEGIWVRLNLREQHGDCNLHSWLHLVLKKTWNEWLRL